MSSESREELSVRTKKFPIKVAWRKQEAATQIRKRLQKGKKTASALLAGGKVLGTLVNYQME